MKGPLGVYHCVTCVSVDMCVLCLHLATRVSVTYQWMCVCQHTCLSCVCSVSVFVSRVSVCVSILHVSVILHVSSVPVCGGWDVSLSGTVS